MYQCMHIKSLQSCPTLHDPHGLQSTRLLCPWDSPGKNTGVGCRFLLQCRKVKSESELAQSCPTPSNPMDCSPPGSSVHGILQARILEWVAIPFSRGVFSTQGSNQHLLSRLHWQVGCLPLAPPGKHHVSIQILFNSHFAFPVVKAFRSVSRPCISDCFTSFYE